MGRNPGAVARRCAALITVRDVAAVHTGKLRVGSRTQNGHILHIATRPAALILVPVHTVYTHLFLSVIGLS